MKNRYHESAASTVAASTASGGSTRNFAAPVMPSTFVATCIELKGWGSGGKSEARGSRWKRPRAWSVKSKP